MTNELIAVLDDNTKTADVIGYATTSAQAAEVYRAYMAERAVLDDGEEIKVPTFAYRDSTSVASPAFEPLW